MFNTLLNRGVRSEVDRFCWGVSDRVERQSGTFVVRVFRRNVTSHPCID